MKDLPTQSFELDRGTPLDFPEGNPKSQLHCPPIHAHVHFLVVSSAHLTKGERVY